MSESAQSSAPPYREAFLALLHGLVPGPNPSSAPPTSGFLVVARKTRSLQELQAICTEPDAPPDCLTARYRIQSGPALGTLIVAFASDLLTLAQLDPGGGASPALAGDLQPAWGPNVRQTSWDRILASQAWIRPELVPDLLMHSASLVSLAAWVVACLMAALALRAAAALARVAATLV